MNGQFSHQTWFKSCACLTAGVMIFMGGAFADPKNPRFDEDDIQGGGHPLHRIGVFFYKLSRKLEEGGPHIYVRPLPPPSQEGRPPLRNDPPPFPRDSNDYPSYGQDHSLRPDSELRVTPVTPVPAKQPRSTLRELPTGEQSRDPSGRGVPSNSTSKGQFPDNHSATTASGKAPKDIPLEPLDHVAPGKQPTDKPMAKRGADMNAAPSPNAGSDAAQADGKEVPMATRTNKANRVKSPYPPFTELDVAGLPSGSLAKDPATDKIFRLP